MDDGQSGVVSRSAARLRVTLETILAQSAASLMSESDDGAVIIAIAVGLFTKAFQVKLLPSNVQCYAVCSLSLSCLKVLLPSSSTQAKFICGLLQVCFEYMR